MILKWNNYSKIKPAKGQRIFITEDGGEIGLATYSGSLYNEFDSCGFGGYEWVWDIKVKYWASLPEFNIPEE